MNMKVKQLVAQANQMHQMGNMVETERLYREVLAIQPRHSSTLFNLSTVLIGAGRAAEAIPLLETVRGIRPQQLEIHNSLCYALQVAGRFDEAIAAAKQAIQALPGLPVGYYHLAITYTAMMKSTDAIRILKEGFEKTGRDPDLEKTLAATYLSMGKFDQALTHYQNLLNVRPKSAELHTDLGNVYRSMGRLDESIESYDRALELAPGHPSATAGKVESLESKRDYENAKSLAEQLISKGVLHADLALAYGRLCRHYKKPGEGIAYVNRLLNSPQGKALPNQPRSQSLLMLGSLYEDDEQYDNAFNAYDRGNKAYGNVFDEKHTEEILNVYMSVFSAENMAGYARSDHDSQLPIYIVGMPRSGTSLVEQILASHPMVHGGGERRDVRRLITDLSGACGADDDAVDRLGALNGATDQARKKYPRCITEATPDMMNRLADEYVEQLYEEAPEAARVTDKNPLNYQHLGLLSLLVPKARVIHCLRHPLDTCFSCFTTRLGTGHQYANDLGNLAVTYRIYRRIMAHWHEVLDWPILDVQYEETVEDQGAMTRRLLDFCNLPFDEACLRFYDNKRFMRTASMDQVIKPVYTSSIGRYKHFEAHLGPLKDGLGEYLEA